MSQRLLMRAIVTLLDSYLSFQEVKISEDHIKNSIKLEDGTSE